MQTSWQRAARPTSVTNSLGQPPMRGANDDPPKSDKCCTIAPGCGQSRANNFKELAERADLHDPASSRRSLIIDTITSSS